MNDIYRRPITMDESILLLLKDVLHHNVDVCQLILKYKKSSETIDTLQYHYNRWETIAGSHYRLHDTHEGKFSLVFNDTDFIVKRDHLPIFYDLTGISYQVIELLHELIQLYKKDTSDTFYWNYTYWIEYHDQLYGILAQKIMTKMKESI